MIKTLLAALAVLTISTVALAKGDADFPTPPEIVSPIGQLDVGCTAWFVSAVDFVTAAHCYDSTKPLQTIELTNGTKLKAELSRLSLGATGGKDAAVFRIVEAIPTTISVTPLTLDCSLPRPGTKVFMTGYPGVGAIDFGRLTHFGYIASPETSVAQSPWPDAIWLDMSAYGGFSGSAVQSQESGEVVGVLVGSLGSNMSMSIAVPASEVCKLLNA